MIPNPFRGVSNSTFPDSDQAFLTLVDGGENGENIPFQPLLVDARSVDTIIAIDAVGTLHPFPTIRLTDETAYASYTTFSTDRRYT